MSHIVFGALSSSNPIYVYPSSEITYNLTCGFTNAGTGDIATLEWTSFGPFEPSDYVLATMTESGSNLEARSMTFRVAYLYDTLHTDGGVIIGGGYGAIGSQQIWAYASTDYTNKIYGVMVVVVPPLKVKAPTTATGTQGVIGFLWSITSAQKAGITEGGTTPPSWVTDSGVTYTAYGLPAGLQLNSATGAITDTGSGPTVSGYFGVQVLAQGTHGYASLSVGITIIPAIKITSQATIQASVGIPFTFQIQTSRPAATITWSPVSANGLSLTRDTISGTPSAATTTSATLTVTAGDGSTATQTLAIISTGTPVITITPSATPSCQTGKTLSTITIAITADGGGDLTGIIEVTGMPGGTTYTPGSGMTGGTITGTPTQAGIYVIVITATDTSGTPSISAVKLIQLTVYDPIVFTSPADSVTAKVGVNSVIPITTTGGGFSGPPTLTFQNLPSWLTQSGNVLHGVPSIDDGVTGFFDCVMIAKTDLATLYQNLAITVASWAAINITSGDPAAGTVGSAYSYKITTDSAQPVTQYEVTGLPDGLTHAFNQITGTPTTPGIYAIQIIANSGVSSGKYFTTLTINPAPTIHITSASTLSGTVGTALQFYIQTDLAAISWDAPSLPAGLSLAGNLIYGTPTAAGTTAVTVTASGANSADSQTLLMIIAPAEPVQITSQADATFTVSQPGSFQLTASQPCTFSATGLPAGLSIVAGNIIAGTPTATGLTAATITATGVYSTGTQTLFITVAPPPAISITSQSTDTATAGKAYTYSIYTSSQATGYNAYNLPPGLSVNTTTGVITGTIQNQGSYIFNVTATDAFTTADQSVSLAVAPDPTAYPTAASMASTLYYNVNSNVVGNALNTFDQPLTVFIAKLNRGASIRVIFHENGLPVSVMPKGTTVYFDVKIRNATVTASLILKGNQSQGPESDGSFLLTPSFNAADDAALALLMKQAVDSSGNPTGAIDFDGEISWNAQTGLPSSSQTFAVQIQDPLHIF